MPPWLTLGEGEDQAVQSWVAWISNQKNPTESKTLRYFKGIPSGEVATLSRQNTHQASLQAFEYFLLYNWLRKPWEQAFLGATWCNQTRGFLDSVVYELQTNIFGHESPNV